MDETKHTPNPGAGHETADVNVWAVGKFGIGLVAHLPDLAAAAARAVPVLPVARGVPAWPTPWSRAKSFPQPQLQQTPVVDLEAMRAEEDQLLNSYAWVDQQKGVVRIPDRSGHRCPGQARPAVAPARRAAAQPVPPANGGINAARVHECTRLLLPLLLAGAAAGPARPVARPAAALAHHAGFQSQARPARRAAGRRHRSEARSAGSARSHVPR